jgi:tetratricopeptide (TPR) repeat protein
VHGENAIRARIVAVSIATATSSKHEDAALIADAERSGRRLGIEARIALAKQARGSTGVSLIQGAIDLLEPDDPSDLRYRAMVLHFELMVETCSLDDPACRDAALHARDAAKATGSTWAMLDARNDQALLEMAAGHHDAAHRMLQEVAKEAGSGHFGSMQRGALVNMATNMLRAGKLESAGSIAERASEQARSSGDVRTTAMASSVRADALRRLGRLDEAKRAIDEAIAIGLDSGETNLPVRLFRRADICAELGNHDSVRADLLLALAHAERTGNAQYIARAHLRLGLLAAEQSQPGALEELARLVEAHAASKAGPVRELVEQARACLADAGAASAD